MNVSRGRKATILTIGFLLLTIVGTAAQAQRQEVTPAGAAAIPFSFDPPGARALGMGGAFIAVADDATASDANPAGLVILTKPEASVHYRSTSYALPFQDRVGVEALGILNGNRTSSGLAPIAEGSMVGAAFAGNTSGEFGEDEDNISFASYVQPFTNWTMSLQYKKDSKFQGSTSFAAWDDFFKDAALTTQALDVDIESLGLSVAFKFGSKFALGVTGNYREASLSAAQGVMIDYFFDLESRLIDLNTGQFVGIPFFDAADNPNLVNRATVEATGLVDRFQVADLSSGDDSDITFNIGFLVNPGGKFSLGGVYKQGGDFSYAANRTQSRLISAPDNLVAGFIVQNQLVLAPITCEDLFNTFCSPQTTALSDIGFEIPDVMGLGISYKPSARFRLSADAVQIGYDALEPTLSDDITDAVRATFEPLDDEIEIHLGFEYIWFVGANENPFSLRWGGYSDPDHDGIASIESGSSSSTDIGEHLTVGLGIVAGRLQVDLAGDFSDVADRALLSLVYRFR